ncbi:putative quinol monooxygenase [Kitasatospora sp. NPDC058170]|uniref:putative quinol monooxygenase n=1 Tax=Kitasatospora sp. NPDC058170 TaxID=3346364 RepID=UPI0036D7ECFC
MYAVVARFDVRPGHEERFDALAAWRIGEAAHEPGLVGYAVHRIDGEPQARVFYEIYRDHAAFLEHRANVETKRFGAEHVPYVTGPPRIEFLEVLHSAAGLAR